MRNKIFLAGSLFLLCIPFVGAASLMSRPIVLPHLSSPQPVFVAIPEEVTTVSPLASLRVMEGNRVVPQKSAPAKDGPLRGVIAFIVPGSVEGNTWETVLHDGDLATSLRPNPLQSPSSVSFTITFITPVRVDSIAFDSDERFKSIDVAAAGEGINVPFVSLRTVKDSSSITFSSVTTDTLLVTITYDTVPTIREVTVNGVQPARILFAAEPKGTYVLAYGDKNPPTVPDSASLSAVAATPFATLGAAQTSQTDVDNDGRIDVRDNCPQISNPDQKDTDHDGIGDACDNAPTVPNGLQNDQDRDGVGDASDNCSGIFNPDQRDDDLNGIGNVCDDMDGDGVINSRDNCPGIANADQKDTNGDGIGDACQLDRDSDGVPDTVDNCRAAPNPRQEDRDKDSIGDACDSCPAVRNPSQEDTNNNGIGDACEGPLIDTDKDGARNDTDNCPAIANADQADQDRDGRGDRCDNCPTMQNADQRDSDGNGQGDACTDMDGDGLLPPLDNCPVVANADQTDKNNNGIGDACDDDDGDGVINATDNCRYVANADQSNSDADALGDACDQNDNRFSEQHPWVLWLGMTFVVGVLLALAVRMIAQVQRERGQK